MTADHRPGRTGLRAREKVRRAATRRLLLTFVGVCTTLARAQTGEMRAATLAVRRELRQWLREGASRQKAAR